MKLTEEDKNLGLPDYMKFGVELEVENVDVKEMKKEASEMGWKTEIEPSLIDSGVETISPVLVESNDKSVWKEIGEICAAIDKNPSDKNRESYIGNSCGGHIHFDAGIFSANPEMMKNFLRIWAESEPIIYRMCNEKNNPIRPGAITKSHKTLVDFGKAVLQNPLSDIKEKPKTLKEYVKLSRQISKGIKSNLKNGYNTLNTMLSGMLLSRNGYAAQISDKIKKQIEKGNLKLGKPKSALYRNVIVKNKLNADRNYGLNLSNIGNKRKNTIEFRMSNGTKNARVVKENVFLYASFIDTGYKVTKQPEMMPEKLSKFYNSNSGMDQKCDDFLELIMDDSEDRKIYKERYESVKDAEIFKQEGKNIQDKSFSKEGLKQIANHEKIDDIKKIFKNLKTKLNENVREGELSGER